MYPHVIYTPRHLYPHVIYTPTSSIPPRHLYPTSSIPPRHLFVIIFLIASFDRCLFLHTPFFLNGTNLPVMPSISYFKQVQHSVAVLFFSKLFQSIFARYVLISLSLALLKFLLHCFLYVFPVFTFILKWI